MPLAVAAALLVGVPAASAATADVTGKGTVQFRTQKAAQVIGVTVSAPGRVRLVAADAAAFKPKCVRKGKKPCVKRAKNGDWVVQRAVRFIYDGRNFTMRVTSRAGFRVTVSGVGSLKLNGRGTYTLDGVSHRYNGNMPAIRLKPH